MFGVERQKTYFFVLCSYGPKNVQKKVQFREAVRFSPKAEINDYSTFFRRKRNLKIIVHINCTILFNLFRAFVISRQLLILYIFYCVYYISNFKTPCYYAREHWPRLSPRLNLLFSSIKK